MSLSFLLLFSTVFASREPQDYRFVHERNAAKSVASIALKGDLDSALIKGEAALRQHPDSALIRYEMGLACNRAERINDAIRFYDEALALDPNMVSALFDRAELHLMNAKAEEAKRDLMQAVSQGANHWGVQLRLAEIAGLENRNDGMSAHLIEAVESGFNLKTLSSLGQPWKDWIVDPVKSRIIRRVVLLYAKGELWDQLQR